MMCTCKTTVKCPQRNCTFLAIPTDSSIVLLALSMYIRNPGSQTTCACLAESNDIDTICEPESKTLSIETWPFITGYITCKGADSLATYTCLGRSSGGKFSKYCKYGSCATIDPAGTSFVAVVVTNTPTLGNSSMSSASCPRGKSNTSSVGSWTSSP